MENEILALPYECWRPLPGYEDIAQVSTSGDVKTVDRWVTYKDGSKRFIKGRILKPCRTKGGYLQVQLSRNGKKRHFLVHRLVAETWLDNPENKPEVNHRDENKENCAVENLSYCTRIENARWGTAIERMAASKLNGSLSKAVEALDPSTGKVVLEFSSAAEAERNGFNHSLVSACCRGERKTHKGFIWRFKES